MKIRTMVGLGGLCVLVCGLGWSWMRSTAPDAIVLTPEQAVQRRTFLEQTQVLLPPMAPIVGVPTVSASQAIGLLDPDELVIGVSVNGEHRAYPINMIDAPERKVINDTLGDEEIMLAWCDRCHTAAVFSRKIAGQIETFGCSGMLWHDTLVIYDVASQSFWNHLSGECLAGAKQGQKLEPRSSVITTWKAWSGAYPHTTVLNADRVSSVFHDDYYVSEISPEVVVFGLREAGSAIAWTFEFLAQQRVFHHRGSNTEAVIFFNPENSTARAFEPAILGRSLTFQHDGIRITDRETGSEWNSLTGQATSGPYLGQSLPPRHGITATGSAFRQFFPHGKILPERS